MSIDVTEKISINRGRDDVASYAMNPEHDPIWIGGITQARLLTEPPVGQGTQVERIANFLGKRIEYILEVVKYNPKTLMVMQSVKGPFPMTVTYQFEDTNGDMVTQIRIQGDSSGFYKLADPLVSHQVRRSLKSDLQALKNLMESNGDN